MSLSEQDCSVYIGNIEKRVTEEIIFELFLQAGPLDKVTIPKDRETGIQRSFGFATFTSPVSVPYAIDLLHGTTLYGKRIFVKQQNNGSPFTPNAPSQMQTPPVPRAAPLLPAQFMRQNSYEQNQANQYGRHTPLQHITPQHNIPQQRSMPSYQGYMQQSSYDESYSHHRGRNTPPITPRHEPYKESKRKRDNQRNSRY